MKALLVTFIALAIANIAVLAYKPTEAVHVPTANPYAVCYSTDYASQLQCDTNHYRANNGLEPLYNDERLVEVSKQKSDDMCKRNYFAHDYQGRKWTYFIKNSDVPYKKAGENLAKGYDTPSDALEALIASPTHRANLLGDYTHIGVYTASCGGKNYTTQTFAKL